MSAVGVTERVLRYIAKYGPCEAWVVIDATGIAAATVHGVIQNLERGGRLVKAGEGEKGDETTGGPIPPVWTATGKPKKKRGPKPQ